VVVIVHSTNDRLPLTNLPMTNNHCFAFAAVLLAAGRSSRMGQPKLLLPWGGTSVLGYLIRQWQDLNAGSVVVICAAGDQGIEEELDRLQFPKASRIYNPAPEQGMFGSIKLAAAWKDWSAPVNSTLTHWAIALGDQPHLHLRTLQAIIEFSSKHPDKICLPYHAGHRRHPVLLPRPFWLQLASCTDQDLKAFLDRNREQVVTCRIDDPGLDLDIDYPADYQQALKLAKTVIS